MYRMSGRQIVIALIVFTIIALPLLTLAQGLPKQIVPENCNQVGGCSSVCDIAQLAQNVLNAAIYLAIILSAFLFAWAGWRAMTSGGNMEQYVQARKIFVNVVIGLVIILAGWIVIDTLMKTFAPESKFGPWNRICRSR